MHRLLLLIPLALCLLGASLPGCGQGEKPRAADHVILHSPLHSASGRGGACPRRQLLRVSSGGCQIKGGAFIRETPLAWSRQQAV